MGTRYSLKFYSARAEIGRYRGGKLGAPKIRGPSVHVNNSQGGCVIPSRFTFPGSSIEGDWFPNPRGKLICSLRKLSF
jgi:hypothetical protein